MLEWLRKRRGVVRVRIRRQAPRLHYVEGENHWVWGEACELKMVERKGVPAVVLVNKTIVLSVRPGATAQKRQAVLEAWYREQLKDALPSLIACYEKRMQVVVEDFGIKKMKTRWGSCNTRARNVWFSLELAKHAPACLEYVVVHELVHLLEASHNARFKSLMDGFMPDWRLRKAMLNRRV